MRIHLTQPVFDRDEQYERSSRLVRWVTLALVLLTYPYDVSNSMVVFTVLLATIVYNGLRYSSYLAKRPFFASRVNAIVVDHVFVFTIVILSGGFTSPYYPLFFLLIVAVIASYGIAGFAISLAAQLLITLCLLLTNTTPEPSATQYQFIIKLVMVIMFSLVAEQTVRTHDEEYLLESRFTKRVENERQRLLALINSMTNAVLAVDHAGKIYLYNAAALELLNTNRSINGLSLNELLPLQELGRSRKAVDVMDLAHAEDKLINRQDLAYPMDDGSKMIVDLTISPVHLQHARGEKAPRGGYMVVLRDITRQKSLDEQRDEFISVTSHELRTPLAIAEANLSTALLPGYAKIEPKAVTLIEQAHSNIIFLSSLIQDLSTLSRAERGDLQIERTLIKLPELLEALARDYRASAEAKGLKLHLDVAEHVKNVYTSEHELREILQNFLTNAIKYTDRGSVTLMAVHTREAAVISVKDTGIGISASDKTRVFDKFFRSEDYRTRKTGGTGLGLYITEKLAERLGMVIGFTSKLNHGSVFTIKVPYHASLDEPTP